MSHFTVAVFTDRKPENGLLEKTLQPWHEYECTGTDDEYVVWVDKTNERLAEWKAGKTSWNGEIDKTAYPTFEAYCFNFHEDNTIPDAPKREDGLISVGTYTNPNRKWDWWLIGGRWRGSLYAKNGSETLIGETGLFGSQNTEDGVDGCEIENLDLDRMLAVARERHAACYDRALADEKGPHELLYGVNPDKISREDHIAKAVSLCPFAVVKDGQWYERGKMGWWASVSDEKDDDVWKAEFDKLLRETPQNHWITIVDCHI